MGGSYNNLQEKELKVYTTPRQIHVNILSSASALVAKRACMQLSSDSQRCQMASTMSVSALDEIFADKELFHAHFGFSCVDAVLDLDKSDLEVDLSEPKGIHTVVNKYKIIINLENDNI